MSARFVRPVVFLSLFLAALASPLLAQQTGSISGRVTATDGSALPGVTVEARSNVLPGPRVTTTGANGDYQLPALPPGAYTLKFTLQGMQEGSRKAQVQLAQNVVADAKLGVAGVEESITVTAEASLIDTESATIANAISTEQIQALPVGQEYRDLQKLIPGVQYSEDSTRGPSAGGSGQDNVYQFDGVKVTLPLFGTLSAEPASHDIAQVTIVKGGARAVDFDRSGGFSMDSVSKSGTSAFHGQLSYQMQDSSMASEREGGGNSRYNQDLSWLTASLGGPIVKDKAYFYGSYYRPEKQRENRANLYGELPDYNSTRNEGFGKLTVTPTQSILINASYRESKRVDKSDLFAANAAATTGTGNEAHLKIGIVEASWVIDPRSYLDFNYTHFTNLTQGRPDNIANVDIGTAVGTQLNVNALDTLGLVTVPVPVAGQPAYNAFVSPLIQQYGYTQSGAKVGGGTMGYGTQFDNDDFFRDAFQVGYNRSFGSKVTHDVHVGYQWYVDSEDLTRSSNGWGSITVPGGRTSFQGRPIFYQAAFQQQTTGAVPTIHSEYQSHNVELNDTIKSGNWTFNVGLLASRDTLFGQGLREDSSVLSGYVKAPGNKYEMYQIPFSKMLQPRLGATWAYNGKDTVYASFARYNPSASSLPRAASWDRNLATTIRAYFDQNGVLFATDPVASSSGKLFVEDMTPRRIDEFLLGTARQLNQNLSLRVYGRHRRGSHFWEDTNNDARVRFNPPEGIPRELYIADLQARRDQIGSGSSYVIAELDGAYTRFWEATAEVEWRGEKTFVSGSFTWSHYYGNFDQDNSTVDNDANIFIGSSNIADDAGRQLWNFKDGTLRGDRPGLFKVYGTRMLPWNANFGGYFVFQSGQPWEKWSYEPYISLTTSTNESNRYAEKAGSQRSDSHWQLDLNYTQNFKLGQRVNFQLAADLYNVFDQQTGYDIEPRFHNSLYGQPRQYFDPRRLQLAARVQF